MTDPSKRDAIFPEALLDGKCLALTVALARRKSLAIEKIY
jgi:hypothetical protein